MSDSSKIDFIKEAVEKGYKTYLYFVCTESVELNIERVKLRVSSHGHNVPEEKIRKRYDKCLALLSEAIKLSRRSFLFDNSNTMELVAEIDNSQNACKPELLTENDIPSWFIDNVYSVLYSGE